MDPTPQHKTWKSVTFTFDDVDSLNAGAVRALVDAHVALHPRDVRSMWGREAYDNDIPPTAEIIVSAKAMTINWSDADVESYTAEWAAEYERREAEAAAKKAADATAEAQA